MHFYNLRIQHTTFPEQAKKEAGSPSPVSVQAPPQPQGQVFAHPVQMFGSGSRKEQQLVLLGAHGDGILRVGGEQAVYQPLMPRLTTAEAPASHEGVHR